MLYNALIGKCGYIHPSMCKREEVIFLQSAFKNLDNVSRNEKFLGDKPKVR